MNRFQDLLESLRQKSGNKEILDALKALDELPSGKVADGNYSLRMPYSSEPAPVDPAWD